MLQDADATASLLHVSSPPPPTKDASCTLEAMTCRLPPQMVLTSIVHPMNEVIMHSSERVAETKEAKLEAKSMVGIWSIMLA